jgi:hypothetical protein
MPAHASLCRAGIFYLYLHDKNKSERKQIAIVPISHFMCKQLFNNDHKAEKVLAVTGVFQ